MPREAYFGNWMSAVAEAAEVAGASELDQATASQMSKAWDMVAQTAEITRDQLAERIAEQTRLPVADLASAEGHATHVVPAELAWRRQMMPLRCTDREVTVATANPLSNEAKREIAAMSGRTVRLEVAPPDGIVRALTMGYGKATTSAGAGAPPPDLAKPGGPHILVVDDDAGSRALFRSVLEEGGFRVTLVRDGRGAMAILSKEPGFDLITLDYFMEGMNGLRVLQQVRAQPGTSELPVIMVTGASDRRIEMSLFEAGADDFIVKPIDASLFLLRIHAVLRRRRVR